MKVMLAPSEAVSQNDESQTIRENHGTPREVSSPSVEETSSNDLEKREKSILLESSCAESFASNKGDCTDEVQVEVASTEANVELTAKFVSEDDHVPSVMDCDCVAGLADALNFVTTPIFEYAFGDDYTDTNSKKKSMSLEEEKNHLLEILLSEFASSKQKKKAANRLMDFEVDEEFLERGNSCFEASCDASMDSTYLPDHVHSTASTTLPHQDTDTSESIIAPENQSQQIPCDRYTPMVTVNEIDTESLCGEGMNESLSTKKSIPDDIQLTEESLSNIRSVLSTEKCDSISLATFQSKSSAKAQYDIGPGELAVLEKHANILGVDVKVLIDARMKATNQIQEK